MNPEYHASIATEIEEMFVKDQEIREKVHKGGKWDLEADKRNTKRAKEIIKQIGYPTKPKVGEKASHHFWFFIQHADHDINFQKESLELMRSFSKDEIAQSDIAYLDDRIKSAEGKPLLYGTQFWTNPDTKEYEPRPIEDMENLDARRISMGLMPFNEYKKIMMQGHQKVIDNRKEGEKP